MMQRCVRLPRGVLRYSQLESHGGLCCLGSSGQSGAAMGSEGTCIVAAAEATALPRLAGRQEAVLQRQPD